MMPAFCKGQIRKDVYKRQTPATAFAPSNPIHAISVILYKVPKNEDAIIGIASFVNDFKIGPFVKFPSKNTFPLHFPVTTHRNSVFPVRSTSKQTQRPLSTCHVFHTLR